MAKTKISEYDATAANNTDIDSINIAEGMAPSNVNNALRQQMAHLKTEFFKTGSNNTSLGATALDSLDGSSPGGFNTAIGDVAATALTEGQRNTALGYGALQTDTKGARNVALGFNALGTQNFTSATDSYNIGIGYDAGGALTSGVENTLIGSLAGDALTDADFNIAIGWGALGADTKGNKSVAIGTGALDAQNFTSSTDSHNVAVGHAAGGVMTTGTNNTFIGSGAASGATGTNNTAIGKDAGYGLTDGGNNTLLGVDSGFYIAGGNDNTVIGEFNGNEDLTDIRNSNDNIAISNGDGAVRIFCNSDGYAKHKPVSSTYYATGGAYHEFNHNNNDTSAVIFHQQHASFNNNTIYMQNQRTASSSFGFLSLVSGAGSDQEFRLRGDGQAYADGSWNGGGADYAEYFEWADGNSSNQDRTGYTVVLDNEKIRIATSDDSAANIIGAVSVNPSVVGDSDIDKWKQKYLKDDFGAYQKETYTITEWTETVKENTDAVLDEDGDVIAPALPEKTREVSHSYETDKIPDDVTVPNNATVSTKDANGNTFERRKLNPDYNPDTAYVSREDRKEWATIGLMGKLRIRKGQQTGDRWIKMRDVSDSVEEWLVR
tara:strand:+ start:37 stop:1851 length:1815 start_codon:yes stop_codon:yes gene_type:complete